MRFDSKYYTYIYQQQCSQAQLPHSSRHAHQANTMFWNANSRATMHQYKASVRTESNTYYIYMRAARPSCPCSYSTAVYWNPSFRCLCVYIQAIRAYACKNEWDWASEKKNTTTKTHIGAQLPVKNLSYFGWESHFWFISVGILAWCKSIASYSWSSQQM